MTSHRESLFRMLSTFQRVHRGERPRRILVGPVFLSELAREVGMPIPRYKEAVRFCGIPLVVASVREPTIEQSEIERIQTRRRLSALGIGMENR